MIEQDSQSKEGILRERDTAMQGLIAELRSIETLFGPDTETVALRVELGAASRITRIADTTVVTVGDLDEAERAALAIGATRHEHQPGSTFRVLLDPAGIAIAWACVSSLARRSALTSV